ncbi:MAG: hypothetical protein JG776_2184 [Caloramator sp.]|uniref:hypothetical protein n=1 Tax=Caloramator sp. TaxID=1871330 RepID=UPI001D8A65B4|nr:hypothetical protein [Caloramator sp.]MBZ4664466.1 hypothetical protein [Caloramator sp.]
MKVIRKYLIENTELINLLGGQFIWLIEKPKEINADNYIIYKYKELNGGYIKDYQIEFNIIGKDLNKLLTIRQKLIELLDDTRNEIIIKDNDTTIRNTKLLNGGGMAKNPETGNYEIILYFLIKI